MCTVTHLMIDLPGSEVRMLRKGWPGYRRTRRPGRVVGGIVLVVMRVMMFVVFVGFPSCQRDPVKLHHRYFAEESARS